jgi:chromosomal replication initiation ATPase DnaA
MLHETALMKQQREWKAARARLFNPKVTVKRADLEQERDAVAALQKKVAKLLSDVSDRDRRIRELELDVSDRDARIISQAEMLAKLDDAGLTYVHPKKPVALIVAEVLKDFPGVAWEDIIGVRRTRDLIKPRHLAMAAVYEQRKDLSLPAIGRIFHRDHTVILHAVDKLSERRSA